MSKTKPTQAPRQPGETDLPEGWAIASLGDGLILDVQPGFACGTHNREGQGIGHLRPMNVSTEGAIDLSNLKFVPTSKAGRQERLVKAGDVIFNNTNSAELVGKTASYLLADPLAFSNHMTRLRCRLDAVEPQFCAMQLHQRWREGHFEEVCNHHVSQASVGRKVLLETPFLLPPLAEQKRIVAKVEALLERVNAARARLAKVPAILKRFRQSVLAAACSGQLTAEWRASEASSPVDEENAPPSCDLRELPIGWRWRSLGSMGEDPRNPVQTGPFGAQLHRSEFVEHGVPVVAVGNLTGMGFTREGLYYITLEKARRLARYSVNSGDVLFARSGATLGKVCLAPPEANDWRMTGHILRLRLDQHQLLPAVTVYALHGDPEVLNQVQAGIRGVTRPGFNTSLLESIQIPVPPVGEQHEIVRRVEALFTLADRIEGHARAATVRAERLPQAILARAFRGELVPTEAELARAEGHDYEPASVLLERIQEAQARQQPGKRGRGAGSLPTRAGQATKRQYRR